MAAAEEKRVRPAGIDEEIAAFDDACGRVFKALDAGMAAAAKLRDAILEGRPEAIRSAGTAVGLAAEVIEKLQYERLSLVRRICRTACLIEPRTIEEVPAAIHRVSEALGCDGPSIPEAEREKAREIARINATCQEMAEDSTEAVNFTLGLIAATKGEGGTYDGRGRVAGQGPGRTILDRKA